MIHGYELHFHTGIIFGEHLKLAALKARRKD